MSMRSVRVLFVCAALLGSACAQINTTNYKFVSINVPGAFATEARGINNNSEIVGWYQTGSACPNNPCNTHGFKLINKVFTTVNLGNKTNTQIRGVNDSGDVAGFFMGTDGKTHGFLLHHTGALQTIDFPNSVTGTTANGVNNSLVVVGIGGSDADTGFIWQNGKFTTLDIRQPALGEAEELNGLSNNGFIVGSIFRGDFWRAWQKFGSDLDIFFRIGGLDTRANAGNSRDDIIGTGTIGGYIAFRHEAVETTETSSEGDLHPHAINFPGAANASTTPWGINFAQSIVGSFQDSSFHLHGFLAVH